MLVLCSTIKIKKNLAQIFTDEDVDHILWPSPLYEDLRNEVLIEMETTNASPIYYADLLSTQANFSKFWEYARAWHR
ncbi:hypothetical protein EVAR_6677_1 [Eumeta japonica]|uniref:Uncharacterized protein n=1 Tax=Eumeta variegata TaxID=151549 RepID=A0A4C1TLF0_EUMVA|nr:hypothetical protein EVAR_6677_1 [Eumeta japonica]